MTSNLLPSVAVLLFVGAMAWLAWLVGRQRHGAGGPASGPAAGGRASGGAGPRRRRGAGEGGGEGGGWARACAHMVGARCDGTAGQLPACAAGAAAGKCQ